MRFRYAKISCPKVMKGFIFLVSDIWLSDTKFTLFVKFWIFKLLVEYEVKRTTERKIFCQIVTGGKMYIL